MKQLTDDVIKVSFIEYLGNEVLVIENLKKLNGKQIFLLLHDIKTGNISTDIKLKIKSIIFDKFNGFGSNQEG